MIVHRILAEDGEDEVYFAKTGDLRFVIEIHTKRSGGVSVSFTELDEKGAAELVDAIQQAMKQ
jgi:hypothetical protein